jgi:hypothetical protein
VIASGDAQHEHFVVFGVGIVVRGNRYRQERFRPERSYHAVASGMLPLPLACHGCLAARQSPTDGMSDIANHHPNISYNGRRGETRRRRRK